MLIRQALRVRLLPNTQQAQLMERIAGCCRAIGNVALDQRRWFARPGRSVSYASQAAEISELKAEFRWFGEAPYHCLQQALVDLETAYKNFWAGRTGAPKPRRRGRDDSFRFPDPAQITLSGNLHVTDKRRTRSIKQAVLSLPKLGAVRCVLHRAIPAGSRLLSVTVSREAGRWAASVLTERDAPEPADRSSEPVVGIDLGVTQPAVLSTGEVYALPRASAGAAAHLARLQQRVANKVKGSKNRRKAVSRLAAFKVAQARKRRDAMEKATTHIAKNHGVAAMEDLRVRNMTASARGTVEEPGANVAAKAGLNRSILDVAPGALRVRLGQKLAATGGQLLLVPPALTSQRCNACGHTEAGNRPSRDVFACKVCGHTADADANAACNIRDRALGKWGGAAKGEVASSTALLLVQQAKPKRSFKKKQNEKQTTGGLPAQACPKRGGFLHAQGRKRAAATRSSGPQRPARSSVL
ncbi:MAG: transposase [Proteobacteria bacterium]|nr:transposase [Pseudomonadota bacterium]